MVPAPDVRTVASALVVFRRSGSWARVARILGDLEGPVSDQIDLHGMVQVPRAALYGFRGFLDRFQKGSITSVEWKEKMQWIDSLLAESPAASTADRSGG